MSDCSMFELEDIAWDIFVDSCDQIAPSSGVQIVNCSDSEGDSHKKAKHDRRNTNERNTSNDESIEKKGVGIIEGARFPIACTPDCLEEITTLASDDTFTSDGCYNDRNVNTSANELSGEPPFEDEGELCNFSLDTPAETTISFLEFLPNNSKNSDLVDYEWPDVSTFDDVERILSYSAFGQGGEKNIDEVSWLSSSSYLIDGSEHDTKSGFPSSSSELSVPRDSQEGIILWSEDEKPILNNRKRSDLEYGSLQHWIETEIQVHVSEGQVIQKNEESIERNNSSRKHQLKHEDVVQYKEQPCTSSVSPSHASFVGHLNDFMEFDNSIHERAQSIFIKSKNGYDLQKNRILLPIPLTTSSKNSAPDLTYTPIQVPCNENQFVNNTICCLSHSPTSNAAKKMEEMHLGKHPPVRLTIQTTENQASSSELTNRSSTKEKLYKLDAQTGGGDALINVNLPQTRLKVDTSFNNLNSCEALSERMLSSPSTLCQLQNVMDQLDIRTKLCLRDGLYRLARSAEQRHTVESPKSKICIGEKSKRCHGFVNMEMETGTNTIDRSIAHLLFGGASEQ